MSKTIAKYFTITFSIENNPYPCHPHMFLTENYYSKFTIMSFSAPTLKSLAENGILKKILVELLEGKLISRVISRTIAAIPSA